MRSLAIILGFGLVPALCRADDFTIAVKTQAGKKPDTVEAKYPRAEAKGPRTVLTAAADAPVQVEWRVIYTGKEPARDVLFHFFVVKIDKPDQQEVPKLTRGLIAESAATIDFKAKDKTEGEISFAAPAAGRYLVRVEIKKAGAKESDAFADLELLVR